MTIFTWNVLTNPCVSSKFSHFPLTFLYLETHGDRFVNGFDTGNRVLNETTDFGFIALDGISLP